MVDGVSLDWLGREWLRGFRVDEETLHHSHIHYSLSNMRPAVKGNHPRTTFRLDNHTGTITQVENRVFATNFLGIDSYPSNQRVSVEVLVRRIDY